MFKMLDFNKLFNKIIVKFNRHFYNSTIINVVDYNYSGYVYNLSIEDDETYFADGFLVHNCRSTTIPSVKPEYDLGAQAKGKRPSIGGTGTKQVSSRVTYGGWLKKQPKGFVDEALGVERSRLFRSGKLSIGKFVDPTGRVYTLSQLEDMNPIAFME